MQQTEDNELQVLCIYWAFSLSHKAVLILTTDLSMMHYGEQFGCILPASLCGIFSLIHVGLAFTVCRLGKSELHTQK